VEQADEFAFLRQFQHAFLVVAQPYPLVEQAVDLPFEFPHRPAVLQRLDLVEGALERIVQADEFDEVCPGQFPK